MADLKITLPSGPALQALRREAERRRMPVEALVLELLHQWHREESGDNPTLRRIAQVNQTPPRQ
ncbi:MAG TPA: hypothetical protein VI789_03350 [Dehalococcoidia bacterium]|nr:hypothetical protein [Dehalococcoidia bacterium]